MTTWWPKRVTSYAYCIANAVHQYKKRLVFASPIIQFIKPRPYWAHDIYLKGRYNKFLMHHQPWWLLSSQRGAFEARLNGASLSPSLPLPLPLPPSLSLSLSLSLLPLSLSSPYLSLFLLPPPSPLFDLSVCRLSVCILQCQQEEGFLGGREVRGSVVGKRCCQRALTSNCHQKMWSSPAHKPYSHTAIVCIQMYRGCMYASNKQFCIKHNKRGYHWNTETGDQTNTATVASKKRKLSPAWCSVPTITESNAWFPTIQKTYKKTALDNVSYVHRPCSCINS